MQNLIMMRERKEGQLRAFFWTKGFIKNSITKERAELEIINEDIRELESEM